MTEISVLVALLRAAIVRERWLVLASAAMVATLAIGKCGR